MDSEANNAARVQCDSDTAQIRVAEHFACSIGKVDGQTVLALVAIRLFHIGIASSLQKFLRFLDGLLSGELPLGYDAGLVSARTFPPCLVTLTFSSPPSTTAEQV